MPPSAILRKELFLLVLITLAGGISRAWPVITDRPIWLDEGFTWAHCRSATYGQFLTWRHHNMHAPLGHFMARVSMDLFGAEHVWALRLPSLLFGIACIPVAFWFGKTVQSKRAGLWMAALVAVDPNMISQSQQARMYSILVVLLLVALGRAIVLLRDPPIQRLPWIKLGALLGAAYWAHHITLAAWAGVAAAIIISGYRDRQGQAWPDRLSVIARRLLLTFASAIVIALPGIWQLLKNLMKPSEGENATPLQLLADVYEACLKLSAIGPMGILIFLAAAAGLLAAYRRCHATAIVLGCVAAATLLIQFPLRMQHGWLAERYLSPLQPALWLGLAMLPALAFWRPLRGAAWCGLALLIAWQGWHGEWTKTFKRLPGQYYDGAGTQFMLAHRQPEEPMMFFPGFVRSITEAYYYPAVASAHDLVPQQDAVRVARTLAGRGAGAWLFINRKYAMSATPQKPLCKALRVLAAAHNAQFDLEDLRAAASTGRGPLLLHFSSGKATVWQARSGESTSATFVPLEFGERTAGDTRRAGRENTHAIR